MRSAPPLADPRRWPPLTGEIPPVPGLIRARYDDFVVEEIPAYEPSGDGDHLFIRIEKEGLTTHNAVRDIARALGVRAADVGIAGLKDARAVARQTISVEHVDEDRVRGLDLPRIRVLQLLRNRRKLRRGHLRGNRFAIRLRRLPGDDEPAAERLRRARAVLAVLQRRGVPNYFGAQRFGVRGDTAAIGLALLRRDFDGAAALIAGSPGPGDGADVRRARELFEAGRYEESAGVWPSAFREPARLARRLARGADAERAVRSLGRRILGFYVSAYQSFLFNDVLARRLDGLDRVLEGDLAERHDSGGRFRVEDARAEAPRAARLEISATGPLYGHRMREPDGEPRRIEAEVLAAATIEPEVLARPAPWRPDGGRRALRFPLEDADIAAGSDDGGDFIALRFTLPPGAYATSVLREIAKDGLRVGTAADRRAGDVEYEDDEASGDESA